MKWLNKIKSKFKKKKSIDFPPHPDTISGAGLLVLVQGKSCKRTTATRSNKLTVQ